MTRAIILAGALLCACAFFTGTNARAQGSGAPSGDAKHGNTVYIVEGCYECHGYQGQANGHHVPGGGGDVGPILAPKPIPYAAFIKQVRTPRAIMPPYSTNILSDKDAADIYAYLASIPPAKDPKSIPILQSVDTKGTGSSR